MALSTPYASASLYVGDLAAEVTEALLFEIFNAVGPVASVRVCRDAATRRSLGYAYVNFHQVDDAERALDTMNFKNIRNRPCRIMWSYRDPSLRKSGAGNIFVKNLAKSIDNKTLYDTFSVFGNILSCKVAVNSKRESLGYGFVHYESEEAAQEAIQRVDGKMIGGNKVNVAPFKSKKERGGNNLKFTNVYVKNLPVDMTKEAMDELFGKYGQVSSSMLSMDTEHKSKGFGFVNFADPEGAAQAVENLDGFEFQGATGKKLYVCRAQKKEEREKELRDRFEQLKIERQKKYAGVNLYVKNLGDDIEDERLNREFSKYGKITSAKVMRDHNGKSRGFGFVCFTTNEEATKAVSEMNNRMLDGKPLYVALAQRKEDRRQQLEQQYAARSKMPQPQMFPPQAAPMFYQGQGAGMPPQRMIYPQQLVPRRWNMPMMGRPTQHIQYQLMPLNNSHGRPPRAGRGRGGRTPPPGKPGQQGQQQSPQQQRQQGGRAPQNFKYEQNVRNRNQPNAQMAHNVPPPAQSEVPSAAVNAQQPLTVKELAAAPLELQKQMIGERLFPLVKNREPNLAGKITGMLLEMDNSELLHLLESDGALQEKIAEALAVLSQHHEDLKQ